MLYEFLTENRTELVEMCRRKVADRSPKSAVEPRHGIAVFLDQLIRTLDAEQPQLPGGPERADAAALALSDIGSSATLHGEELLQRQFTIGQVVHDYGDLCQAITELALERNVSIKVAELHTLNRSLDNAIASAVTKYASARSSSIAELATRGEAERLGRFVHELRNHMQVATLALAAIKAGNVGMSGATGAILDRSMIGLKHLIDRAVDEVRAESGPKAPRQLIPLAAFIAEAKVTAMLQAQASECAFSVPDVDIKLAVEGDHELLMSAVSNLLQNAFKFSHAHGEVSLHAFAVGERVLIEVSDSCGGLPAGLHEDLLRPFVQAGENRSGLGLGLSIVKRSIEEMGGRLHVHDHPPIGCTFTIQLPRKLMQGAPGALTRSPSALKTKCEL